MRFNQDGFNDFIISNDVVGFFEKEVTLASGRKSHWYVNWRRVSNDVFLMDELSDYVLNFTSSMGIKPDCFYGVPEGATKLAILAQFKLAKESDYYDKQSHCLPMGRAKPKEHGDPKDKFFVGEPKGKVICLEDVTTTGASLIKACETLKSLQGTKISCAIGLTDRMEIADEMRRISVKNALYEMNLRYESMSNAEELLPLAIEKYSPNPEIVKAIEAEYRQYGIKPLILS